MDIDEFQPSSSSYGRRAIAITPNDNADIPGGPVKAIVLATPGTIAFVAAGDDASTTVMFGDDSHDMPAGFIPPFQVRRVMDTGTTATIIGIAD